MLHRVVRSYRLRGHSIVQNINTILPHITSLIPPHPVTDPIHHAPSRQASSENPTLLVILTVASRERHHQVLPSPTGIIVPLKSPIRSFDLVFKNFQSVFDAFEQPVEAFDDTAFEFGVIAYDTESAW